MSREKPLLSFTHRIFIPNDLQIRQEKRPRFIYIFILPFFHLTSESYSLLPMSPLNFFFFPPFLCVFLELPFPELFERYRTSTQRMIYTILLSFVLFCHTFQVLAANLKRTYTLIVIIIIHIIIIIIIMHK